MTTRIIQLAGLSLALALTACSGSINSPIEVPDGTKDAAASKTINGAIRIGNDVTVTSGSFRSVNGSATVGARSSVPDITLVNGSIRIGEDSTAADLATVNGSIAIGMRSRVNKAVTVNGSVLLAEGASVVGDVTSVNGRITLDGARVAGRLENVNGGMRLLGATVVEGGLVIAMPRGQVSVQKVPQVIIGRGVKVLGPLRFERAVDLRVHREAEVGEITGATPQYFDDQVPAEDESDDGE